MISYTPLWHTLINKGMNKGGFKKYDWFKLRNHCQYGEKRASQLKTDRQDLQSSSLQDRGCYRI